VLAEVFFVLLAVGEVTEPIIDYWVTGLAQHVTVDEAKIAVSRDE
jgi:hypothetical protein